MIHRRSFEKDVRRHFVGQVEAYEDGIARATGYVFVIDDLSEHLFVKRPDCRTRLIAAGSGDLIVNVIPKSVDIEAVGYQIEDRSLRVTDGSAWSMDVKEFGWG